MIQQKNTISYKVISLFIKALILFFALFYITSKMIDRQDVIHFETRLQEANKTYIITVAFLMFINWGLEAMKWQYLIRSLEKMSFINSLIAVFSGVTVSVFMPNRVGEFAGRIFYLEKADKVSATLKNFLGSLIQLSVTLITGVIAIYTATFNGILDLNDLISSRNDYWFLLLGVVILLLTGLILLRKFKHRLSGKIRYYLDVFNEMSFKEGINVFVLSTLRYAVFLIQYYLLLLAFGIEIDFWLAATLIALNFFIQSFIPSFALTEVFTRGATAVYLFADFTNDSAAILAVSFLLWVINLALPALIGAIFVGRMKFFKTSENE
ncbi:MAG: flippase-like domain-containing protein [Bacteroidetes bacterium]|nr:flippase-like domain-containing protein [Bacteroidota bacterium]